MCDLKHQSVLCTGVYRIACRGIIIKCKFDTDKAKSMVRPVPDLLHTEIIEILLHLDDLDQKESIHIIILGGPAYNGPDAIGGFILITHFGVIFYDGAGGKAADAFDSFVGKFKFNVGHSSLYYLPHPLPGNWKEYF